MQLKKFFARYYHMDRLAVSALPNSIGLQPLPESHDSVLNAPIAVKDQAFGRLAAAYRHVHGFQSQYSIDTAGKGITHNFAST